MDIYSANAFVYRLGHCNQQKVLDAYHCFESEHGVPERGLADGGDEFNLMEEDIRLSRTSSYHPQGNAKLDESQ